MTFFGVSFAMKGLNIDPTMSRFQSLNCLPSIRRCVSRDTRLRKRKENRAAMELKVSIIPQTKEINTAAAESNRSSFSNKSSADRNFSGLMTDQTNVIGILGGDSTLNFTKKLVGQENELPFILCMDPLSSNELLSLDRSSLPFLSGRPVQVIDHSSIVENLRRKRAFLEKSGVCCIVMPCHISHSWYDEIKEGCTVPFLHMGESVAKELKEAKLGPIEAGSSVCIGVLATNATLATRMYQKKLENEGFEVIMPDNDTMKHIVIPAVEALSRKDFKGAQNLLRIALQVLLVKAVNRIILASDELRQLLPPEDPLWRKCIDPTDALARSTVDYAQSAGRSK